ncbi:MAG: HEAT repeat domain-containing protein [Asgard group archaeon]|nr:HEAT repeat domain-containing protein [Asgard group archaeon]
MNINIENKSWYEKKKIIQELAKQNSKEEIDHTIDSLIEILKNDEEEQIRKDIITIFSKFDNVNGKIIDTLIDILLHDKSELVRKWSSIAIGEISPTAHKAIPSLIEALRNDESNTVKKNAIFALGKIGKDAKEAIPALKEFRDENDSWWVNSIIESTLIKIESP